MLLARACNTNAIHGRACLTQGSLCSRDYICHTYWNRQEAPGILHPLHRRTETALCRRQHLQEVTDKLCSSRCFSTPFRTEVSQAGWPPPESSSDLSPPCTIMEVIAAVPWRLPRPRQPCRRSTCALESLTACFWEH